MKHIKYWHVKLFQSQVNTSLVSSVSGAERLLHEGYSKDEVSLPPRDGRIKLLTEPCGVEVKTVRADVVDSIVCTPVYEEEEEAKADSDALRNIKSALSKNTHLLKSEFFTIECDLPTPEELDKIFSQLCEEFDGSPLSCLTFPAFFNEIVERTKGLTGMKMNVKPECMFSQNALRGKSIRPKH
ncbi:hypothetical protein [Enterobacter roggenkampii]|uniref:hypothetical protein n=1 Tax=Enterobacter roggenkampii TaxID=1812935 RepID=UPI00388EE742